MNVIEINEQEFFDDVLQSNDKILVDCYASWCAPCKMLFPIIDDLAQEIKDCKFYKIDVDNALKLLKTYGIMSIPTILIFDNKKLKIKLVGLKTKEEIKKSILN